MKDGKPVWYAEVYKKGMRKGKTFCNRTMAQQWALSTEESLSGGVVSGRTLGDAMEKFARDISPLRKGERWEQVRLKKMRRDPIASTMLDDLTTDRLQEWVDDQCVRVSPSTANRDLTVLVSVLKTARLQWKWMHGQPYKDIRRPKDPAPRDRRISQDEIEKVLKALDYDEKVPVATTRQQIAVAFLLALETAMRQGELWGLEWRRVHLKERYVVLEDTKNGSRREVPLTKRAVELLQKMKGEDKVFTACAQASMEALFRKSVKLTKIRNLRFHDARHEAITRLARKVDVLDLARIVGHRDLRSLQIYYNPTASEIACRLD